MKQFTVGVDIGGTNTDAVIIDEKNMILALAKTTTTEPIVKGFTAVIDQILKKTAISPHEISGIFVGTTHATNALLQRKDLFRVGVLRISGSCGDSIPTAYDWPKELKNKIVAGSVSVKGGFYCDGRAMAQIQKDEVKKAIHKLFACGMESVAIIGTYASINKDQEIEVSELVREIGGFDFPVTLSSDLGGINFLERENASLLNAALKKSIHVGFQQLSEALVVLGFTCPLYLTQNNGTILTLENALQFPVLTISAGPTNSFVGASKLSGLNNAIVADIGGTSTDVGIVIDGFARSSVNSSMMGGVKLCFQMPDVQSIALGGGSKISIHEKMISVGPQSVANDVMRTAQAFGGNVLTLTDIAILNGLHIEGADASKIRCTPKDVKRIFAYIEQQLDSLRMRVGGKQAHLPFVLVGGGAHLLRDTFIAEKCIIPDSASVANAYGAALAEISGTIDTVVCLKDREEVLAKLQDTAKRIAVEKGASLERVRIIEQHITPYHYLPKPLARVRITAAGGK